MICGIGSLGRNPIKPQTPEYIALVLWRLQRSRPRSVPERDLRHQFEGYEKVLASKPGKRHKSK